jgi:hypothetical protein
MKLPGAERAFVDPAKVRDYLLNVDHPVGHSKARFFGALGFTRARWPALYGALLDLAVRGEATIGEPSPYGQKYEIHATISGPAEREAYIVTVWIVLLDEDFPRLVTAFPGGPR